MERLERSTFRLEGGDSIQLNYMGNKIILNKFLSTCTIILARVSVPVKSHLLNLSVKFFHSSYQNRSHSFQHSVKNMLHNPEDIVPQEGVEPSRLAAAAFEVAVSTIPPPGHVCLHCFSMELSCVPCTGLEPALPP